jgi:hypothetical protein
MVSTPKLPLDFVDLLAAFAGAKVRFLVIGGYAVGFHDRPRATKDLDLMLGSERANIERTCQALRVFGAPDSVVQGLMDAASDEVVWFGAPPTRVDLLQSAPGFDFETAYARRLLLTVGELEISIVGLEDLIAMKKASGRDQDMADVRRLMRQLSKG